MKAVKVTTPAGVLLSLILAAPAATAADGALGIIARFAIGGNDTGYDYLKVDSAQPRLYVAHGNRVEVLALPAGNKVGELAGMHGVHGIEIISALGKVYTSDGLDRQVSVFDPRTLAASKRIGPTGVKPDAIQYDSQSGRLFVVNGGETGDLTIIDPRSDTIVRTIALGGVKLEQIGFDGRGHAFINDEGKSVVHVLDTATLRKTGEWSLAPCEEPTGLAVDRERHRVFSVCGNGKMAILDSDTGRLVSILPISGDPDGVAFDARRSRVFVSNREGLLDVYQVESPQKFVRQPTVRTGPGARTLALDADTGTVYVPTARFTAATPGGKPELIPDSFAVLAIGRVAPKSTGAGSAH
ncbi:MAG: YncE family protein [Gammaproteobacteria bacterium]|nr:YncE family protein [Gammaproteobacteria bacterium]